MKITPVGSVCHKIEDIIFFFTLRLSLSFHLDFIPYPVSSRGLSLVREILSLLDILDKNLQGNVAANGIFRTSGARLILRMESRHFWDELKRHSKERFKSNYIQVSNNFSTPFYEINLFKNILGILKNFISGALNKISINFFRQKKIRITLFEKKIFFFIFSSQEKKKWKNHDARKKIASKKAIYIFLDWIIN